MFNSAEGSYLWCSIRFVTFTAGNFSLWLNSHASLYVCSHMTGTSKMGGETPHNPIDAGGQG